MIYCDFVHIDEANVYGISNPRFVIKGSIHVTDYKFKLLADGEEIKFHTLPNLVYLGFCIEADIKKTHKHLQVFVIYDGKETLIVERENSIFKRVKSKIRKMIVPGFILCKKINHTIYLVFESIYKAIRLLWREHHFLVPISMWGHYKNKLKGKIKYVFKGDGFYNPLNQEDYIRWLEIHPEDREYECKEFKYNPKISIVIPVYNVGKKYLVECIESILNQNYQNFEICLSDDCSTDEETLATLKEYEASEERVKVVYRQKNGHISKATNDAIAIASGEFIGLMDNDDLLAKNALYEVVKVLNKDSSLDMIYTDEDKIDIFNRRRDPHFKPDFSPDSLLSSNYICHFTVLRKKIIDKIGGFRVGYEGSQDHDLFLRFTEKTDKIYHIPKVLYHWRMIPGSTAESIDSKNYAVERGKKSVEDALKRRGCKAVVSIHPQIPYYMIDYLYDKEPKITIIIPTKDYSDITEKCLESLFKKTTYKNFEVILMNNQSKEEATFQLFERYQKKYTNFKVINADFPFNYSKINNLAVSKTESDFILLLNNDTEIITPNWLETMVGYAMQDHIGTVGCKLLYPDNTVQHGGIVMGVGGIANHAFLNEPRESFGLYARLAIPYNYSGNTAACLMVSRKIYEEVGGLEEELNVAFNDVDFNLKVIEKGFYNIFLPQVELYHYESKSRGLDTTTEKYKRFLDEQYYMHKKWGIKIEKDPMYNINFSRSRCFVLDEFRKDDR